MRKDKCYQGGNKHNFQPRYTEIPRAASMDAFRGYGIEGIRKLIIYNEYIKDICIWCGKEIKK